MPENNSGLEGKQYCDNKSFTENETLVNYRIIRGGELVFLLIITDITVNSCSFLKRWLEQKQ